MVVNISIKAGSTKSLSSVEVSGTTQHVITDEERLDLFKLKKEAIKSAVKKYFGRKPDDVYVHGPTPWNDLYSTNGWEEVKLEMVPVSSKIVSVSSQAATVNSVVFENDTAAATTISKPVSKSHSIKSNTTWDTKNKKVPTVGEKFAYQIECKGASDDKANASIQFSSSPGKKHTEKQSITVGSETPLSVHLPANEKATVKMTAQKCKLKVAIAYQAFLTGNIVVNYNKAFRGQTFWAIDVGTALAEAGIRNKFSIFQTIELQYMCDAFVELEDTYEPKLPVSALSVGPAIFNNEDNVKRRVRSLTSLRNVVKERGSFGETPDNSMWRVVNKNHHRKDHKKKDHKKDQKKDTNTVASE